MIKWTRRASLATLALAAITALSLVAVACGGDDDDYGDDAAGGISPVATQATPEATQVPGETPEATEPATGGIETIKTAESATLGTILVTLDGYTLYMFDNDTAGAGTSACLDACSNTWPPLPVVGEPSGGSGVTGELTTFSRPDGITQVAYDGKPLYLFANDASPGDTNGDGIGGVWHAAKP